LGTVPQQHDIADGFGGVFFHLAVIPLKFVSMAIISFFRGAPQLPRIARLFYVVKRLFLW
ncbi:MAG: hypothetical protein FWD16_02300, partial [Clostridia bacterium]|nr:hypothetical protein [Clostridia bacterium]